MKTFLYRTLSIVRLSFKRLFAQRGLAAATSIGLIVALGLVMSVPLYTDAVYFRILRESLIGEYRSISGTPLSFRFRYVGARDGEVEWENLQAIDSYLSGQAFKTLHLPEYDFTHHYKTEIYQVFLPGREEEINDWITWVSFSTLSNPERHIQVVQGTFPQVAEFSAGSTVEALIYQDVAEKYKWQVGDSFVAKHGNVSIPFRISGIWAPVDPLEKFWSAPLEELAIVPEATFSGRISAYLKNEIYLGIWQTVADGGDLHVGDIAPLLSRIDTLQEQAISALPKTVLDDSPVKNLQDYQKGVPGLTFLLFAYSVPIVVLLLAFISLVVGLYVDQQRNQIAVLRSRGATKLQVVGIALLEGLLLGGLALVIGSLLGMGIARLIGQARSFMNFSFQPDLRVGITPIVMAIGLGTVFLMLIAQMAPTISAAGHTILTYKQERARMLRSPWWQRIWLDVLLLIPTGYGFYILQKQGSLAAEGGTAIQDLFQNPLLFLTPSLGLFALTLFLARLLPYTMAFLAWLTARTNSVGMLMATRQLARSPGLFTAPLILLTLTLSLSTFTASLAQTLDGHLTKEMYYKSGADLRASEVGLETGVILGGSGERWLFKPVSSHLKLQGVTEATRVGRFQMVVEINHVAYTAVYIGIDRLDFPKVGYWQKDFAGQSLGELMNLLAASPENLLVSSQFLADSGRKIGDEVSYIASPFGEISPMSGIIVGVFDIFPTWYPEEGPLFIGNLNSFFQQAGKQYPYEVWMKTAPGADHRRIIWGIRGLTALLEPGDHSQMDENGLNIFVTDWQSAPLQIFAEQRRPPRQGLFGLLSVGFVASASLTVLGFLLYALFSFRRRFIELGVLRAIGLSKVQMILLLAWELAALILIGMLAGTGLGVWVSAWFIPYLQVGADAATRYPPFIVSIAWGALSQIYLLFGLLFAVALGGLTALLVRMKIFQAVKLGETT
jgi:putative ABC transport system permease protein